jgi:hypothetical protein
VHGDAEAEPADREDCGQHGGKQEHPVLSWRRQPQHERADLSQVPGRPGDEAVEVVWLSDSAMTKVRASVPGCMSRGTVGGA